MEKAYIIIDGRPVARIENPTTEQFSLNGGRYSKGKNVVVAGAITDDGQPVNMRTEKYSTAKKYQNAQIETYATRHECDGLVFFMIHYA